MRLRGFRQLGPGRELPVLPAQRIRDRNRWVRFPTSSSGLTAVEPRRMDLRLPRFSLFSFPHVTLSGYRLYKTDRGYFNDLSLVAPGRAERQLRQKFPLGYTEGLALDAAGEPLAAADVEDLELGRACVLLCSDEPASFGSWMFRVLPKLLLARRLRRVRKVMVYSGARWMAPFLSAFAPGIEIVEHDPRRTYRLERPLIASLAAPDAYLRSEVKDELEPFVEAARRAFPDTPERVYISRRKLAASLPNRRVLEQEVALAERLRGHGYHEFFPEESTITEQAAVIAGAREIISVGGSNLFGCYFARRAQMIVDLEAARTFLHAHSSVLASTGVPFSIVHGAQAARDEHGEHGNWTIDLECLFDGLAELGMLG